ncbi:unnamed protein product [Acanthoscelides obtectus]|uniref:Uncharacterized protein n=1 Tax=Acanthoscelides obtectus TaxID=200917 RepID=A0A9P0K0E4_ACAOB|nr:unnamed protein product [Acanthoscelides obtectus]CAK1658463.1 hypothetical protein AOBTE_LOCUS20913 [Acanthoscelides obtectus]
MLKVTLQGHSETQGHTSRSLGNSRSHFKVTRKLKVKFQGLHRRSALKVVSTKIITEYAANEVYLLAVPDGLFLCCFF